MSSNLVSMEFNDIRSSTVRCEALISSCLSTPKLAEDGWARDRLDDLKLWSTSIGATVGGHASLEWRLRSRPDVKEVVLGFLDVLHERIQECLQHAMRQMQKDEIATSGNENLEFEPKDRAFDSRSSSSSGSLSPWSELSEDGIDESEQDELLIGLKYAMKGAETSLAQLTRISLVIRKAGAQLRHQRADTALQSSLPNYDSFRKRLELLFIWNPYQEDVSPYRQLLFRRLTSNETQKNLCPRIHAWPGSPSPSIPSVHLKLSKWKTVYKWVLSQDTGSENSESALEQPPRRYLLPATLSSRYKRDTNLPHPMLITAHEPQLWATTVIRKVLADPERLTSIQKRLIQANIKRRHRFEFARGNAKPKDPTPEKVAQVVNPVMKIVEPQEFVAPVPAAPAIPQSVNPLKPTKSEPSIIAKSVLSATELGSQQALDFKAPSASAVTRVSATGQQLKYPPRPMIHGDRANFECHYCCQVLPRSYGEQGWRGHIMQDLQPYSCVLEGCPTPNDLYGSRKDWESHMEKIHSADKWICYVCTQSPQIFESAAEYESHLMESPMHVDTFTEAQLPFLVEDGRTPTIPDFITCPLCNWSERHAEFDELPSQQSPTHNEKTTNIQDHVAEHLHSFALQALPDLKGDDADSLHTSVGSVENIRKNLLASDVGTISYDDDEDQRMHLLWKRIFHTFAEIEAKHPASSLFSASGSARSWFQHWGSIRRIPPPFWTSVLASNVGDSIWALDECGKALDESIAQQSSLEPAVLQNNIFNVTASLNKLISGYQSTKATAARRRFRVLVLVVQACRFLNRDGNRPLSLEPRFTDPGDMFSEFQEPPSIQNNAPFFPPGKYYSPPSTLGLRPSLSTSRQSILQSGSGSSSVNLSISEATAWRRVKKNNTKGEAIKLPGAWLLDRLKDRNHVFIIDDTQSMRPHWDNVVRVFDILAYISKETDGGGIDLYFTMSSPEKYHSKHSTPLVEIVRKRIQRPMGAGDISIRLDRIAEDYTSQLYNHQRSRRPSRFAPQRDVRPLSLYILTDGHWVPRDGAFASIMKLSGAVRELKLPKKQVGIQFITFGDGESNLRNLGLEELNYEQYDIVDTTSSNGNVWKMLLGATDSMYDEDGNASSGNLFLNTDIEEPLWNDRPSLRRTFQFRTSGSVPEVGLVEALVNGRCVFCDLIHRFFEDLDIDVRDNDFKFHISLGAAKSSALLGCALCQIFVDAIEQFLDQQYVDGMDRVFYYLPLWGLRQILYRTIRDASKPPQNPNLDQSYTATERNKNWSLIPLNFSRWNLRVLFAENESGVKTLTLKRDKDNAVIKVWELCCARGDYLAVSGWTTAYTKLSNPLSLTAISTFGSWLRSCETTHKNCSAQSIKIPPSRLLDIGGNGFLRLIANGAYEKYAAVSYCWGGGGFLTLRSSNLSQFMEKGIPHNRLPRVIEDAVVLTKKLGLRYLWVDSLCIVQDDGEDAFREIKHISNYFENSSLTIAATSAGFASEGFLRETTEQPLFAFHCRKKAMGNTITLKRGTAYLRGISETRESPLSYPHRDPLLKRAWAFQDMILSPRVLSFGSKSIVWSCNAVTQYDSGVDEHSSFWEVVTSARRLLTGPPVRHISTPFKIWMDIVHQYSGMNLAMAADRLIAIQALVWKFEPVIKSKYLAGMWRADLLTELLWFVDAPYERRSISQDRYVAPSWSWASNPVQVSFKSKKEERGHRTYIFHEQAKILEAATSLKTNDLFGAINHGFIRIQAPFMDWIEFNSLYDVAFKWDDATIEEKFPADIIFLMISSSNETSAANSEWVRGIAIIDVEGSRNEYRRIGLLDGYRKTLGLLNLKRHNFDELGVFRII